MIVMPPEFYGVYNGLLEAVLINNNILIDVIKYMDQPEANNVKIVLKSTGGNRE